MASATIKFLLIVFEDFLKDVYIFFQSYSFFLLIYSLIYLVIYKFTYI